MTKTCYIWDVADTLVYEIWNQRKSGFADFNEYVKSLGYNLKTISPLDYEGAYEIPYKTGLFDLKAAPGFRTILKWAKHNIVFTTGNREQMDWRMVQLRKKINFDIRDYFQHIYSTFDYGNTNKKTVAMMRNILAGEARKGARVFVYVDDKLENCRFFRRAAVNYSTRIYNLRHQRNVLQKSAWCWKAGGLYDIMRAEISLMKKAKNL